MFTLTGCKNQSDNQLVIEINNYAKLILPIDNKSKITSNIASSDLIAFDSIEVIQIELKNVDYKSFTIDYFNVLGDKISFVELKDKSLSNMPFIDGQTDIWKDNLIVQGQNLIATRIYQTDSIYDATWVIIYNNLLIRVSMAGFTNLDLVEKIIQESELTIFDKTRVKKNSF